MFGLAAFPDFVYTRGMQLIQVFAVNAAYFVYGYMLTSVMLAAYGEKAPKRRIFWVVFLRYNVARSVVIYLPYALMGFDTLGLALPYLATPNPFFSLFYFFLQVKVLRLPKHRSVHSILIVYLSSLLTYCLNQYIQQTFFPQPAGKPYNYLLEIMAVGVTVLMHIGLYCLLFPVLRRKKIAMVLSDSLVVPSVPKKVARDFGIECLAYALVILVQVRHMGDPFGMMELPIIMGLSVVVGILALVWKVNRVELQNKSALINLLSSSIDQFRGIKHDFYNLLHTYSGFITIGSMEELQAYHEKVLGTVVSLGDQMDLNRKLEQNPALVALIAQKIKRANECDVYLRVMLLCNISRLYVEDMSICRVLGNLLDNAIEAAMESEARKAELLMETKPGGRVFIVVSNSTHSEVDVDAITVPGMTTKKGHEGLGLIQVRSILSKYPNCSLRVEYYENQFRTYIEIYPEGTAGTIRTESRSTHKHDPSRVTSVDGGEFLHDCQSRKE